MVVKVAPEDQELNGWHLDKRVPLGLIFAIILQTIVLTVFLRDLRNDVDNNEKEINRLDTRVVAHDTDLRTLRRLDSEQAIALGKIEVELVSIKSLLERMENKFDNARDRYLGPP